MEVLKVGVPTVGFMNFGTFVFEVLIVGLFGLEQVEELALEEDESVDTSLDKQIAESVVSWTTGVPLISESVNYMC